MLIADIITEVKSRSKHQEFADAKCLVYLNQAQRELDQELHVTQGNAVYYVDIAAAAYYMKVQGLQAISSMWVLDSDGTKTEIVARDINWLRTEYGLDFGSTDIDQGVPTYYALYTLRNTTPGNNVTVDEQHGYRGMILMPPADELYRVYIYGTFDIPDLTTTGDTAVSYFTAIEPHLLIDYAVMLIAEDFGTEEVIASKRLRVARGLARADHMQVEREMLDAPEVEL